MSASGAHLETCFAVTSRYSSAIIALESLEAGGDDLKRLVTLDSEHPRTNKEICLHSPAPVTIYVEIPPGGETSGIGSLDVQYDVITVDQDQQDDMEGEYSEQMPLSPLPLVLSISM